MYEHEYGYQSGINGMMRSHLEAYNAEIQKKVLLQPGDSVLDIGSNDATFLRYYPDTLLRVGCDPTGIQFQQFYAGLTLIPTYFTKEAVSHLPKFKVVSSISMFYDLSDPVQFAKDVRDVLTDDGIWTLEQSYIITMLDQNSVDTICHEHIEYYALAQIQKIMCFK
jgi:NDP-4-keto-2,6-dideoxyhexose 3-C-methyltransferase